MQQQSMSGNREEDGGGAVYETYVNQMPRQAYPAQKNPTVRVFS